MKIRSQLALACFVLSILPLSAIVLYSYQSSREALEAAYHAEASRTTRLMDRRLATIRTDLQDRLAELSAFPLQMQTGTNGTDHRVSNDMLATLGDTAPLIDSLEFQPVRDTSRSSPSATPAAVAGPVSATPAVAPTPAPQPAARVADAGATPAVPAPSAAAAAAAGSEPAPPTPPPTPPKKARPGMVIVHSGHPRAPHETPAPPAPGEIGPIVIDIPETPVVPAFGMSAEQRRQLHEIGRLSSQLSRDSGSMDAAQRAEIERQLDEMQKAFTAGMIKQADLGKTVAEKVKEREAQRKALRDQLNAARAARAAEEAARRAEAEDAGIDAGEAQTAPQPGAASEQPAAGKIEQRVETHVVVKRELTDAQMAELRQQQKRSEAVLGQELRIPVRRGGAVVANLSAQVRLEEVIRRVLGTATDDGEVAFAADRDGNVYTRTPEDRRKLDGLGVTHAVRAGVALPKPENWIVSMSRDPQTGVRVGVARPVGNDLAGLRRAAAMNFSAGIALIVVALVGIMPVASHITRDVKMVTAGAERIASGDLTTRVPIQSKNEFGQLAAAFNKMATDLSHHQEKIVEQERTRKEQELQQRMLEMEYSRKSVELEEARRFQLSMLPKEIPTHAAFDIAVSTETATEVGGDYYDFHAAPEGVLTVAVGDATGHGAKAGTMITVAKTLFASYSAAVSPSAFLGDAAEKIKRMDFSRMAMSLLLGRFQPRRMTIAAAGMPPALIHRAATGAVEEISVSSTPLGTLGNEYKDRVVDLEPGDTVLLLTDGFPELLNADGQQLGYSGVIDAFRVAAKGATASAVIDCLSARTREWRAAEAPNDDITFVVVRVA